MRQRQRQGPSLITVGARADAGKSTGKKSGETRRRAFVILIGGTIVMAMITVLGWLGGLRINLTPSEPIGL